MGECVVRMEIPVNCDKCDLRNGCKLYVDYSWSLSDCFPTRPKPNPLDKGCLIICQLPEGHGRLIDADKEIDFHINDFERIKTEGIDVYRKAYSLSDLCDGVTYAYDHANIIVPAEAERSET